ncbi:unnamed protein product, partial [marine sediment metagenome]
MRQEGQTIEGIGKSLGVSAGAVSGWCRDIAVRRQERAKEGLPGRRESKATTTEVVGGPYEEETKELANRLKRAEIEEKLSAIEDRHDLRKDVDEMRLRE